MQQLRAVISDFFRTIPQLPFPLITLPCDLPFVRNLFSCSLFRSVSHDNVNSLDRRIRVRLLKERFNRVDQMDSSRRLFNNICYYLWNNVAKRICPKKGLLYAFRKRRVPGIRPAPLLRATGFAWSVAWRNRAYSREGEGRIADLRKERKKEKKGTTAVSIGSIHLAQTYTARHSKCWLDSAEPLFVAIGD